MSKVIAEKVEEIKAPAIIQDLHNLNELADQEKIYLALKENLDKYKEKLFMSFVMNIKEILEYIPESKQHKYFKKSKEHPTLESFLKNIMNASGPGFAMRFKIGIIVDTKNHELIPVGTYDEVTYSFSDDMKKFTVHHTQLHRVWHNYDRPDGENIRTYTFDVRNNRFLKFEHRFDKYDNR